MKTTVTQILRYTAPIAIIAWLVYSIQQNDPDSLKALTEQPKRWGLLFAAFLAIFTALIISLLRWWLLVRALDLPFRISDALRLGLLGYLFNFVSLGVVGGDLFKAVFIAREQSSRRAEAVATVLIDRIVGLFGLLCVASIAMALVSLPDLAELQALRGGTFLFTSIGAIGLGSLMIPGITQWSWLKRLETIPKLGPVYCRASAGLRLYQRRWRTLLVALGISLFVHGLIGLGLYFASHGIYNPSPSLIDHLVISPVAGVAGSVPLLPGGFGQFELAIDVLYDRVSSVPVGSGQGLVVAFCYRVITVAIAIVGAIYYVLHRREVSELVREAEAIDSESQNKLTVG